MLFLVNKTSHTVFFNVLNASNEGTEWGSFPVVQIKKQKCRKVDEEAEI